MALNATTLQTAIESALATGIAATYPESAAGLVDYHVVIAQAVAVAVVNHLKAVGAVNVTVATTCGAGAGTGTGTGTMS